MDNTLADSLTGRLLDGRYAVTARIARGGMATVYLAMDTRLDREVALKVMHAELARDDDFVRRFIGEAKSVARLSHQNVVAVFDQGADGPLLYLAMEYVPGRTLKEMLNDSGRLPPAVALEIMTGVLGGLAAAHTSGIVHRDVKPENVLLTADGRIKVADFGLARALTAAGHTRTGLLIGTVAYVPPEQVTGNSTGPRGDVYSAGVMLFEMLTGRLPFTGDTPLSVAYQHVNNDVPAPSTLTPGLPAAVDQLVLAATSRDPGQRPADAGEFLRAVRQVCDGLRQSNGLSGVLGVGVQGLDEAPWLDLATPAATNGWWTRTGALPTASGSNTPSAPLNPVALSAPPASTGSWSTGNGAGHSPTVAPAQFGGFGDGQFGGGRDYAGSHTLVVHRDGGQQYSGHREPILQRWLFSPRLLIIVLIVAIGVGLGLGGWWLTSGRYTQVPVVAGDSVALATTTLTSDGFVVKKTIQSPSNTVGVGKVLSTTPTGRVSKGSAVTLVVSSGPFTSKVPSVANDTLAQAQAALQRVNLTSNQQKMASNLPVGTVLGTKPTAGTSWPQTSPVTILISAGPALPNFSGETYQQAQQWAQQHNVTLQQQPDNNSQQASGTITGQQPKAGSTVQPGETITVNVSTGPQLVNVPSVIGMSVSQATQTLEQAGFQVQVNRYGFLNKVFDFSPVGQAARGSTITLDVGF